MSPNKNAMKNPSYRQVCSGITGHIEVLNIELNEPTPELFEELIRFFFMFHDPTTLNRQGNDVGKQYGSVIFTNCDIQASIAKRILITESVHLFLCLSIHFCCGLCKI